MDEEEEDIDDEMAIGTEGVIPYVRIYLSFVKLNNDMMELPEIIDLLTQDGSPTEKIKEFLDQGVVNIYACNFNTIAKIL